MSVLITCSYAIVTIATGAGLSVLVFARWGPRVSFWATDRQTARGVLANEQQVTHPTRAQLHAAVGLVRARRAEWQHRHYARPASLADDHRLTCAQQAAVEASRAAEDELNRIRYARSKATRAVLEVIRLRMVLDLPVTADAAG